MMIGETVLFDNGKGEGTLISVVGRNAFISTTTGPVQRPIREVRSAPVKVVTLDDSVGAEEIMEIVQRPVAVVEEPKIQEIEEDDGSFEDHAEEAAAEAEQLAAGEPEPEESLYAIPTDQSVPTVEIGPVATNDPLVDFNARYKEGVGLRQAEAEKLKPIVEGPKDLPQRFGKTWLAKQTVEDLRALLARSDIQKSRLAKIQEELDKRGMA